MKRKADFVMHNIGGEKLLVPIGAQVMKVNGLITLNNTGAYMWELLIKDQSTDELAVSVTEEFDVDLATAHADVQTFIKEMTKLGILEL